MMGWIVAALVLLAAAGAAALAVLPAATSTDPSTSASGSAPESQASVTPSRSARSASTSRRGETFPLTYWLTCDLPSFWPRSAAMRTRSACLRPARTMAAFKRFWKALLVIGQAPKFNFASSLACKFNFGF